MWAFSLANGGCRVLVVYFRRRRVNNVTKLQTTEAVRAQLGAAAAPAGPAPAGAETVWSLLGKQELHHRDVGGGRVPLEGG